MAFAQLNIGRLVADTTDPRVADFMNGIAHINQLGKDSPGFLWIMEGSSEPELGNTDVKIGGDPRFIANMTVWQDIQSLENFAYKTEHLEFFKRRLEWLEPHTEPFFVIWPVDADHQPSLEEGLERLEYLKKNGESEVAFGWAYARKHQK